VLNPERLRKQLQSMLTPGRYRHSLCVQRRASALARLHGADWFRAGVAGLVHDVCHCMPPEVQLKYLEEHGILLDDFYLRHPQIWHAITGSILLCDEWNVGDKAILRAVRYHTTGREEMTGLEKIVYLADATSEDRDYPGVLELRALADADLNRAMYRSLHRNAMNVVAMGEPVVTEAWEALRYYSAWKD